MGNFQSPPRRLVTLPTSDPSVRSSISTSGRSLSVPFIIQIAVAPLSRRSCTKLGQRERNRSGELRQQSPHHLAWLLARALRTPVPLPPHLSFRDCPARASGPDARPPLPSARGVATAHRAVRSLCRTYGSHPRQHYRSLPLPSNEPRWVHRIRRIATPPQPFALRHLRAHPLSLLSSPPAAREAS